MTWLVHVPVLLPVLLLPVALWPLARIATRAGRPERAARALAAGAVVTAGSGLVCLLLVAATLADDVPAIERYAHLSAAAGGQPLPEPIPDPLAVGAAGLLLWIGWRAASERHRRRAVARSLHAAGPADGDLLVADWDSPRAVAVPPVPGRRGHVLVTSGLLRLLDARERRAVLAHERAHLRHRHDRTTAAAGLATAINPLLRPVASAVDLLVERSADEDAARTVADRRLVAHTIAKVALAAHGPEAALGFGGSSTVRRVEALVRPTSGRLRQGGFTVSGSACVSALSLLVAAAAVAEFAALLQAWLPTG
ncbi:M56 family metallopeptidase [Dactylosporangium matsuzakiense]|uniref:M56 family metallopeptidase n=1 Tax=Dactylosporangium matsuzakiense TaxID=53360 RepID=UPI0021C2C4CB|nr:M56 family metallopeptidase [Dactylosporangium matsuzakiense]